MRYTEESARAPNSGETTSRRRDLIGAIGPIPEEVSIGLTRIGGPGALVRSIPGEERLEEATTLFSALSDPARLRILLALDQTSLCPCLIREVQPMKDSVRSYHLKVLKDAGLVERVAVNNYRVYRATRLGMRTVSLLRRSFLGTIGPRVPRAGPLGTRRR